MKRFHSRLLSGVLAAVLAISTVCAGPAPQVQAEETNSGYEIYPTPHEVSYQEGEYTISSDVNVVLEKGIDEATENRLMEILNSKDITVTDETEEGKTTIYVGVYNSGLEADQYVQENYDIDTALFEHFGSHYLISNNNEICVLGKDTDAAFYGLTSLMHIFNQMDGTTIRNFKIKDYADVNIRGFIEGYYGIPWSNEDRMSLMEFGGKFKMTSYVFAPKDDPYHKNLWRELYPEEELNAIKEMVAVGNASKCKFVWTAHPFMGGFNQNDVENEIAALLNKFDQLYEAGVRQFGVLGDDVGNLPRTIVIQIMNAVSDWAKEKGDVYDSVFCPGGYNDAWQGNYSELNDYDAGFPDDVQIFWTGQAVCKPIEQLTLTNFRTKNRAEGEEPRRAPLFWLNWPVNDINMSRLMMGKGSLLHTDITIDDLAGAVTNPMQDAQASKVAIFAVADYTWNVRNFDDDKSWADSFKYIEPDAAKELHTLAKHMSNPQPNGHGLVLAESEELQPLINEVKAKLAAGEALGESGTNLIAAMNEIITDSKAFHEKSQNAKLKEELKPFTDSLSELAQAIIGYAETRMALDNKDNEAAFSNYMTALSKHSASKEHLHKGLDKDFKVSPGSTHLIPLADAFVESVADEMNAYVNGGDEPLVITASSSFSSFYSGAIENIIDGNAGTFAWYGGGDAVGQYYQVNLSKPTTIYGIHIQNGAGSGKEQDTFKKAVLKYSTDGTTWQNVNDTVYGDWATTVNAEVEIENVVAVRYECTQAGGKWPSMREFKVDTKPNTGAPEFTMEVIRPTEGWGYWSGTDAAVIDGDDTTGVHYAVRQGGNPADSMVAGDYIGVKLSKPITLGKIHIVADAGGDYIKNGTLQYSMDGANWKDIQTFKNQPTINVDVSDQKIQAQYVRLLQNVDQKNWLKMFEFNVAARIVNNGKVYTNVESYKNYAANYLEDSNHIAPVDNVTLEKDQYIGLKLDRIHELKSITSTLSQSGLTIEVSKNQYEWTAVEAGAVTADARYIRLINKTDAAITFNIDEFRVMTNEVSDKSLSDNKYSAQNPLNVFDGDWTTQTIYQASQNAGKYVVYDLGQTIHFESFKAVCRDSEIDFPRHAKFSVSTDGKNWTEIMTLGNQDSDNPGESTTTDEIGFVLPNHEISYNTKLAENLDVDARYLKFEITRTKSGKDKWVRFQELEINGGEFVPTVNDPTVITDAKESAGNVKGNMIDKEIATTFKPVGEQAGSFTYYISDYTEIGRVSIMQNPDVLSNAKVAAEVVKNGEKTQVDLGTLNSSLNEFTTDMYEHVLSVKVEWTEGNAPQIHEIVLVKRNGPVVPVEPEEPEVEEYTAYVIGGENVTGIYNTKVELHAAAEKDGKTFAYWRAGETAETMKPVYAKPDYTFYLAHDVYVEAVYESVEAPAEEIASGVELVNTIAMPRNDDKVNARFVGQLTVPKNGVVKRAGLVWSTKETPATLKLGESGVKVTDIKSINSAYQFSVTINGMPKGKFVRGVAFAVIELPDGTTTVTEGPVTVYSEEGRITN